MDEGAATKADLAELKADLHETMIFIAFGIIGAMAAFLISR